MRSAIYPVRPSSSLGKEREHLAAGRSAFLVRVRAAGAAAADPDQDAQPQARPEAEALALRAAHFAGSARTTTTTATVVKFPCGHVFKYACAKRWLAHQSSCPTCRQEVGRVVRLRYDVDEKKAEGQGGVQGIGEEVDEAWDALVRVVEEEKSNGTLGLDVEDVSL